MWVGKFWSHVVHSKRLTERLHYFFLRVRPFDAKKIERSIARLVGEKQLGSIRCYAVFGRYDLIVGVWLHPALAPSFKEWMDSCLVDCRIRRIRQFVVDEVVHAWYHRENLASEEAGELLNQLDKRRIRGVQDGKEDALLGRLMKKGLVLDGPRDPEAIRFFVTIRLERQQLDEKLQIAKRGHAVRGQSRGVREHYDLRRVG